MTTEKQLAANRANAQKSTGPRTETGKVRSSLNALKHGCTSQTMVFPGQDANHFHNFHQSLVTDLAPVGALEAALVQDLAQTQWAIFRIRAHEANLFALGHQKHADAIPSSDPLIQAAFAGALTFKYEGLTLKDLSLYLQRHNRMFQTTLKALREIQAARKVEKQAEITRAAPIAYAHQQQKIPFTASEFGFDCSPEELAPYLRREAFRATPKNPQIRVSEALTGAA